MRASDSLVADSEDARETETQIKRWQPKTRCVEEIKWENSLVCSSAIFLASVVVSSSNNIIILCHLLTCKYTVYLVLLLFIVGYLLNFGCENYFMVNHKSQYVYSTMCVCAGIVRIVRLWMGFRCCHREEIFRLNPFTVKILWSHENSNFLITIRHHSKRTAHVQRCGLCARLDSSQNENIFGEELIPLEPV